MGRRGRQHGGRDSKGPENLDFSGFERTLADVEAEAREERHDGGHCADPSVCPCGSRTFALQAFLEVTDGRVATRPVETDSLTCPECGREYEPVELEDGRIVRGAYLGRVELDD
jgi:hypothetical protein